MLKLFPIFIVNAINQAVISAVFIQLFMDTMHEVEWDKEEKASNALLCMLGLGVGESIGAILAGRLIDKCPVKCQVIVEVLVATLAYSALILYASFDEFSFVTASVVTTLWGF